MNNIQWTSLFVLLAVAAVKGAPYHQVNRQWQQKEPQQHHQVGVGSDEPRQMGQLLTGLVGSAVGTVATPILGPLAPALGGFIGSVVGQAVSSATTMALSDLQSE